MVSVKLDNVSLVYKLHEKLTLSAPDRRVGGPGGRIEGSGRKQFVQALDGISFELKAGDRLGLVGPNGAGKTTLLKGLYGIYEPSGGSVAIEGKVDALFNINIGFRREATGRRNIVLRGLISGWTEAEIEEKMEDIIAFSELGDFIDPGQAGLVIVGESKVEDAIKHAVTRAEKQTAKDLDVSPKDVDKALQETVKEM